MADYDLNISCSCDVPAPITPSAGETVKFINNTGALVKLAFTDGDAFKPKKTKITLASPGSETLTIGSDKKKTKYKWKCPEKPELATRTGRIDPS
jgi:hypothetical protein